MKNNREIQSVALYIVQMSWPYIKIIAKNVHLFILRLNKISMEKYAPFKKSLL